MRKVSYTVMIPDDMDIDSVTVNLECKEKTSERHSRIQNKKRDSRIPIKRENSVESDEGILYDELY